MYVSDKESFDAIDPANRVYYTFSNASAENIADSAESPESGWAEVSKSAPFITVDKKCTVRLVTVNSSGEKSDVSEYHLGVKPARVTAEQAVGRLQ